MKSRDGKSKRREENKKEKVSEERRSKCAKRRQKRKSQKKEDPGAQRGRKVAKTLTAFFPQICGSGGSKSRLTKAAGCGAIWPDER